MAYTTIDKPSDYFNTKLYTGTGSAQNITGVGFQPDFLWVKERSSTSNHMLFDVVRGGTLNRLNSNTTSAEITGDPAVAFLSDGFSVSTSDNGMNENTQTYAAWNWLADNTSGSSNSDGSITSTVAANTTSGFSIVKWTGTGANGTIGHGLGVAPSMIIVKADAVKDWMVGHNSMGWTKYINLNTSSAESTASTVWQDTAPTSSFFSVGSSTDVNTSSTAMIAYCFAEKKGFSKFGSYTGTGSTDGPFIYTGFKPAWLLIKRTSATENWVLWDNKRDPFNNFYHVLFPNASSAEDTTHTGSGGRYIGDFLSNGFKLGNTHATSNASGSTYIYMAFAENPFVTSTGVPATAT